MLLRGLLGLRGVSLGVGVWRKMAAALFQERRGVPLGQGSKARAGGIGAHAFGRLARC